MSENPPEASPVEWLRQWALNELGLAVSEDQPHLLEDRLVRVMSATGQDLPGIVRGIRSGDRHIVTACCDALVTNETQWMRDSAALEALAQEVLPERVAAKGPGRLSVWSAATSSGQEVYSLAMLLDGTLGREDAEKALLLGSDVSSRMVTRAIAGRYSQMEVDRGLPARLLLRYFDQEGSSWRVSEDIRARCRFFRHNLVQSPPPGLFDAILCRYVLIYFSAEARRKVLQELSHSLKPGGVLVLGASEMAGTGAAGLTRTTLGGATFYQAR